MVINESDIRCKRLLKLHPVSNNRLRIGVRITWCLHLDTVHSHTAKIYEVQMLCLYKFGVSSTLYSLSNYIPTPFFKQLYSQMSNYLKLVSIFYSLIEKLLKKYLKLILSQHKMHCIAYLFICSNNMKITVLSLCE